MAIRLLKSMFGHPVNTIVRDISYDMEARIVASKDATYNLANGIEQAKQTVRKDLSFVEQNLIFTGGIFVEGVTPTVMTSQASASASGSILPRDALLTVACGNSIAAKNKFGNAGAAGHDPSAELYLANAIAGSPMKFNRMTDTTRSDRFGVYSYPGQTLETINGDISAQWFAQFATAGITPELFVGIALLENDISQGFNFNQMVSRLKIWIANVQRYTGSIILLCTPRPSFGYDTESKVKVRQEITDYMLGLDDGKSIFVCNLNGYENPDSPGTPFNGYTDATVHPNTTGAFVNARTIAETLKRILPVARNKILLSNNYGLSGSVAASAVTGVSGTMPTGCGISAISNGGSIVSLAENPGWLVKLAQNVGMTSGKITLNTGSITVAGAADTQLGVFSEIEIVSGAECIGGIFVSARVQDSTANLYQAFMVETTASPDYEFKNGDVLTLLQPPIVAPTPPFVSVVPYLYLRHKTNGSGAVTVSGTVEVRIRKSGVIVVK